MILRRLTKNVKDQNWFAVGLDFCIVVARVFVGRQAQQWAAYRDQRRREVVYLERPYGEVLLAAEMRESNVAHPYRCWPQRQ